MKGASWSCNTTLPAPQLLLGYLPRHTPSWAAGLAKKREEYARFCEARPEDLTP